MELPQETKLQDSLLENKTDSMPNLQKALVNMSPMPEVPRPRHHFLKPLLGSLFFCILLLSGFLVYKSGIIKSANKVQSQSQSINSIVYRNNGPHASLQEVQTILSPHEKLSIKSPDNLSAVDFKSLPKQLQDIVSVNAAGITAEQGSVGDKNFYIISYSAQGMDLQTLHQNLLNLLKKDWTFIDAERSVIYAFIEEQNPNYKIRITESIPNSQQQQNIKLVSEVLAQ